jgi:hypothetical protein
MLLSLLVLSAAGCASTRRFGDADGTPVSFTVHVERAFFDTMSNHQGQPSVGAGAGFSHGGSSGLGLGLGFGFSATSVFLLGGDEIGQAHVFRKEVKWGDQTFTVPLLPGRSLFLGVQAEGGRQGWESVGHVTIPTGPDPQVRIVLNVDGSKVSISGVDDATPRSLTP